MIRMIQVVALFILLTAAPACTRIQRDIAGPVISDISTSDKVVVISDCQNTEVTITARVTDNSEITRVTLRYRVESDSSFLSTDMNLLDGLYSANIKGSEFLGHSYGNLEFYITAEDGHGNISESPHDSSIQFLPCVNN